MDIIFWKVEPSTKTPYKPAKIIQPIGVKIKNNNVIIIIPKTEKLNKKGDFLKPLKILIFLLTTIIPPFSFFIIYNIQF